LAGFFFRASFFNLLVEFGGTRPESLILFRNHSRRETRETYYHKRGQKDKKSLIGQLCKITTSDYLDKLLEANMVLMSKKFKAEATFSSVFLRGKNAHHQYQMSWKL
jgi:hypothetical protein